MASTRTLGDRHSGSETKENRYGGWVETPFAGVLIVPKPANVRPCRWHTRSYGYMAANPLGCKVFGAGPERKTAVKKGEPFHFGFGLLIHAGAKEDSVDLAAAYRDCVGLLKAEQPKP